MESSEGQIFCGMRSVTYLDHEYEIPLESVCCELVASYLEYLLSRHMIFENINSAVFHQRDDWSSRPSFQRDPEKAWIITILDCSFRLPNKDTDISTPKPTYD